MMAPSKQRIEELIAQIRKTCAAVKNIEVQRVFEAVAFEHRKLDRFLLRRRVSKRKYQN